MKGDGNPAPIFVVGNPKSGTTLLQALLDGHPDLYVIPVEIQFFKFPRLPSLPPGNMPPPPHPQWKTPVPRSKVPIHQLREELLDHAELGSLLKGESLPRNIELHDGNFDGGAFVQSVREARPRTLKGLYLSFLQAFPVATDEQRDAGGYRIVEKCPHMEEYGEELQRWFPGARFIHVLRNPYANLYTATRGVRLKRYIRDRCLRHMAKSYYFMERNQRYLEGYRVVRYEDVVLHTEETMRRVAGYLGIPFTPSLTEPTVMGHSWGGNPRSVDGELEGIDPRPVDMFESRIEPFLVALVNRYCSHLLEKYDYKMIETGGLAPYLPLRWETPWHYWENRRLLWSSTL